jgi:phosphate-selective porin OprO/OprP
VHPFEVDGSGRGACDIAGRVNTTNLIDRLATANGIAGGRQTVYTAA